MHQGCKSNQTSWVVMEMGWGNQRDLRFERCMGTKVGKISTGDFSASMLNVVFKENEL